MFKLIYKIGQRYRNPSISKWFKFLKTSERWSVEELEKHQLKKLQEICTLAYQNATFYQQQFDKNHLHPSDIKSLDDLKKIPVLSKQQLLENVEEIHTSIKFKKSKFEFY